MPENETMPEHETVPDRSTLPEPVLAEAARRHRLGVEEMARGEPLVAARELRGALRKLGVTASATAHVQGAPERDALAAKILTTLAHAEAELGRTALGFALLVRCEALADPADRGIVRGQRALLLLRTGRAVAALPDFDWAVERIDPDTQAVGLARVLLNRSVARIEAGDFAGARADSERCRALAEVAGQPLLAVKALHNIGYCDLVAGDLPAALRVIGEAADGFARLSPSWRPVVMVDVARALLQAGLASDAAAELDAAIALFRRQQMSQDRAEAEAVRAEAALLAGDAAAARRWARAARTGFLRRDNASGAAAAELIGLQADFRLAAAAGQERRVAARAGDLAARLRGLGLRYEATAAELVGVRARIAAGDAAGPKPALVPRSLTSAAPLEVRILHRLTLAELAAARGDRPRALRTLRSGLALLARHRVRLGSVDLQTGTAALGVELAAAGLALTADRPRQAFAWSELSRAQSLRIRPVRPPTNPEVAHAVAELRRVELGGRGDPSAAARRAALEARIRRSAWPAAGSGPVEDVATLDAVAAELAARGTALVSLFQTGGSLFALVVADGRCRVRPLGPAQPVYETSRRLRADIVALVGRVLPARMEKTLAGAVAAHAEQLNAALLEPGVLGLVGDRDLVVVPCGPLAATPWSLLPALRGRALSVAPSATSWLGAVRTDRAVTAGTAVLVAGPGLRETGRELAAVASQYPDHVLLDGAAAQVEPTLRALDGAATVHLAVHGHHDPENPLFSRLELADGPLMAYDLLHLQTVPRHVVLSACDVGHISMRPGDEPLGVVATLLHAGCPTVVAAAAPVADAVAAEVMGSYHRLIGAGQSPAAALAAATAANPLATFSCFGAG